MRFLFYSHDGLGLGHTQRNLAVAAALTQLAPEASVLLATGVDQVNWLGVPPNVEILKLPGLRKVDNGRYVSRRLRLPEAEIRELRSELLLAAVKSFRPQVVLVDKHPVGVRGEFLPALEALRAARGHAVLGLRDILDSREAVRQEWTAHKLDQRIAEYYDRVLVYGHASVFDPVAQYDFPRPVSARTRFCGYVVNRGKAETRLDILGSSQTRQKHSRPVVLATAGGGEDGFCLLETFIRAASQAAWQGIAITGPMVPLRELETLKRLAAESRVDLHTFVPNVAGLLRSVQALVCMGGYNTLGEALSHGLPTVCVPRIFPRSEQLMRAVAFDQLGFLHVVQPQELSVEKIHQEVDLALKTPRQQLLDRISAVLNFDGARQAASQMLALASWDSGWIKDQAEPVRR